MITYEAVYADPSSKPFISKTIDGVYTKMSPLGYEEELSAIPDGVIDSHFQNLASYIANTSQSFTVLTVSMETTDSQLPFLEGEDVGWALEESSLWWQYRIQRLFTQEEGA